MSSECGCKRIDVRRDSEKRIGVERSVMEIGIAPFCKTIVVVGSKEYVMLTDPEYVSFKSYIKTKIDDILQDVE